MLRPYQQRAIENLRQKVREGFRAPLLVAPTGSGKCLAPETPIIMYSGRIVQARDVRAGDVLMGPDSKPRNVINTCSGFGQMFRIVPVKGEPWVCNDVHVLTLVNTTTGRIIDVPLNEYLEWCKWRKHMHKLFSVSFDFEQQEELTVDPYFMGLWFADGTKGVTHLGLRGVAVSKPDPEVETCMEVTARQYARLSVKRSVSGSCPTFRITRGRSQVPNHLLEEMRYLVGRSVSVPQAYLTASRSDRLSFLAGWLDGDGHLGNGGFEVTAKRKDYADAICFVARSLGFKVTRSIKVVNGDEYQRMYISGDTSIIPNRIPRKQGKPRKQIKNHLRTGFSVEAIGEGPYVGWTLDGDGRFLLGDGTVTHNTVLASSIAQGHVAKSPANRVLMLVHRIELVKQSCAKLESFGIRARSIQGQNIDGPQDAVATVAMIPTLAAWKKPLPDATLVIVDECHHSKASTWERIASNYAKSTVIGLTATPERSDGKPLGDIFDCIVPVASVRELTEQGHLVPCAVFAPGASSQHLADDPVDVYLRAGANRRCIVFCQNVAHSEDVAARLTRAGVAASSVDGAMDSGERAFRLRRFKEGNIRVLCNCAILTEGFDDPGIEMLILARGSEHPGLYIQMVGRILRPHPGKHSAECWDLKGLARKHGMPDDDREYSLTGEAIVASKSLPPIKQCRFCGAVFRPVPICPMCGRASPMPEPPEVRRQRLEQIAASDSPDRREQSWQRFLKTAHERGYDPRWATHMFRAKYGEWRHP